MPASPSAHGWLCCHAVSCSETYQYYTLPFCLPKDGKKYVTEDLGEVLEGDRLVNTPFAIKFREDVENQVLCSKTLDAKDLQKFRQAVAQDYYFQVQGMVPLQSSEWQLVIHGPTAQPFSASYKLGAGCLAESSWDMAGGNAAEAYWLGMLLYAP